MKCGQGSPGLTRRCALDPLNARTSARYSRANSLPTCARASSALLVLCHASDFCVLRPLRVAWWRSRGHGLRDG